MPAARGPTAPIAQSRHLEKKRPSQKQFFIPLCLPNHTSTDQVTTSLRSSIAVSSSLLAAWGFRAAPAHTCDPKSDSFVSGAGKTSLPLAAALRGGRAPSLASLVANGCCLTLYVIHLGLFLTKKKHATIHYNPFQKRVYDMSRFLSRFVTFSSCKKSNIFKSNGISGWSQLWEVVSSRTKPTASGPARARPSG